MKFYNSFFFSLFWINETFSQLKNTFYFRIHLSWSTPARFQKALPTRDTNHMDFAPCFQTIHTQCKPKSEGKNRLPLFIQRVVPSARIYLWLNNGFTNFSMENTWKYKYENFHQWKNLISVIISDFIQN